MMTFASSMQVYCLYPRLTSKGRTLPGFYDRDVPVFEKEEVNNLGLELGHSTWHWKQRCGSCCQMIERSLYDVQDIGIFRWSSACRHQNFLSWVKQREYRWKFADHCGHPSHSYRNIRNNNHPCFSG